MIAEGYVPLDTGQVVVLGIEGENGNEWYRTRVAESQGDLVWVDAPVEHAPRRLPTAGKPVVFHTWRDMDARYTLQTTVVGVRTDQVRLLGLRILDHSRTQQREYVRVPVSLEAAATAEGRDGQARRVKLKIHDMSGGGLRARSSPALAAGTPLRVQLLLPDAPQALELPAIVARVIEPPDPHGTSCLIGVAFVDLPPSVRERIIRFVLRAQIERRRRGMD